MKNSVQNVKFYEYVGTHIKKGGTFLFCGFEYIRLLHERQKEIETQHVLYEDETLRLVSKFLRIKEPSTVISIQYFLLLCHDGLI